MKLTGTRAGTALPVSLLLMSVMTAGAVAALAWSSAEFRVLDHQRAQTAAFAVAEAGLEQYLARGRVTPADTTLVLPGGTARVRATLMRSAAGSDSSLYLVRADAEADGAPNLPGARRTVAQLAWLVRGRVRVRAAWSSYSGLEKSGVSGLIDGSDACGGASVAGVNVPDGMYAQSGGGNTSPVAGAPAIEYRGRIADMVRESPIDWSAIIDPASPALQPDIVVCYPGTAGYDSVRAPCGTWPTRQRWTNRDYWATIMMNGSAAMPGDGRGTLIVTGDLTLRGTDSWDGLVLVGGQIVDNGTGTVSGAVISGLNVTINRSVAPSKANGTKTYRYDACNVQRAVEPHSQLIGISNAWVDNWTAW